MLVARTCTLLQCHAAPPKKFASKKVIEIVKDVALRMPLISKVDEEGKNGNGNKGRIQQAHFFLSFSVRSVIHPVRPYVRKGTPTPVKKSRVSKFVTDRTEIGSKSVCEDKKAEVNRGCCFVQVVKNPSGPFVRVGGSPPAPLNDA